VLPDGSIVDVGDKFRKCQVTIYRCVCSRNWASPRKIANSQTAESICVLLADFTSIEAAGAAVSDIISAGIIPAGMEMMDNLSINAVEDVVATGCYPEMPQPFC